MDNAPLLTQRELAQRWNRPESAISWASALGVGPHYLKHQGQVLYPLGEIEKYERACLFFSPADVAFQGTA